MWPSLQLSSGALVTGKQLPEAQVKQGSVHRKLQQTRSVQNPLAQSPSLKQSLPFFHLQAPNSSQV
jgi:hypothetical protein